MSIEPQCIYCKAHDKFRCRSQDQADECANFMRRQARLERARNPEPEVRPVTIEEIDAAIDALQRVKKQLGAPDVPRKATARR